MTSTGTPKEPEKEFGLENVGSGIDELLDKLKPNLAGEISVAVATPQEVDGVIRHIVDQKKMPKTQESYNKVLATSSHMCQIGATSPRFNDSRMITDYGVELRASELKEACRKNGITVRKFARGIRDYIVKVAIKHKIQGNLSKNYKLENPGYDDQDLVWVADFQTFSENPAMPDQVKEWLLENYRNRFRPDLGRDK